MHSLSPLRRLLKAFTLWLALTTTVNGFAAETDARTLERNVKAAYLYKFLGYVDWPPTAFPQPAAPLVIGILGADDIADELIRITSSRTVNNRPLSVRRLRPGDSLDGIQLLFIGQSEAERQSALLRQVQQRPVLSVTESDGALAQGSVINFRPLDGRVRFDVSLPAAERNELKLSSRLLAVAASVQGATP